MSQLKFRAYDGENFWYFDDTVGVFYLHFGGEQSSFDDPLEFSEVIDKGWTVDQWSGSDDIYTRDKLQWLQYGRATTGIVKFKDGCFYVENYYNAEQDDPFDCFGEGAEFEVIGNTHEDSK
jgi:hypothetical protein